MSNELDTEELEKYLFFTSGGYEGASVNYKNSLRKVANANVNSLAARELLMLRLRSEHLIRNDPYAETALNKYSQNLGNIIVNWVDDNSKKHTVMQEIWDEFTENPNLDGYGDFNSTQDAIKRSQFVTGTAFIRFQIRRKYKGQTIPLKLQHIPTEYHALFYNGKDANSFKTRYGITFEDTKPNLYHFTNNPLDVDNPFMEFNIDPYGNVISLDSAEILHIFKRLYAGQWLGIPLLSSALITLYQLSELTEATINKQKAAQALAFIVTKSGAAPAIGAVSTVKNLQTNEEQQILKNIGSGVSYINKGESITSVQGTDIGNNLLTLYKTELYKVSSLLGIPYYEFTGNTEDLNFSSIIAIGNMARRNIEYINRFFMIPMAIKPIAMKAKNLASLYYKEVSNAKPVYELPRWYGTDELKDAKTDILEIQHGVGMLKRALAERNITPEELLEDREFIKAAGLDILLVPDKKSTAQLSNNRANTNSEGN